METSVRLSANPVIPFLVTAIEKTRLAIKRQSLTVLIAVITLFVLICSLATWPSIQRMLLVIASLTLKRAGTLLWPGKVGERVNHCGGPWV